MNDFEQWDPDGPGPLAPQLVIGGTFHSVGGSQQLDLVAIRDRGVWRPLKGLGPQQAVHALKAWDADGDGPEGTYLYAGGSFTVQGMSGARRLARWDGAAWQDLGGTGIDEVRTLTTWDPDGPGPQREKLIVGGDFTAIGGISAARIASWDGQTWSTLGAGFTGPVYAVMSWDPDGDGPITPRLVAGGAFTRSGTANVVGVAIWDGAQWRPVGSSLQTGRVYSVCGWDPDAGGPEPENLVIGGAFTWAGSVPANHLARWDGSVWREVGGGVGLTGGLGVRSVAACDPDGDGPEPTRLYVGGNFAEVGGVPAKGAASWDNVAWRALSTRSQNSPVTAWQVWEDDSIDQTGTHLLGASYSPITQEESSYIASWDGDQWRVIGSGLDELPRCALEWNEGGSSRLLIGGPFSHVGSESVQSLLQWNGDAWSRFGAPLTGGDLLSLYTWDRDGDGPEPPAVVAGGSFTQSGSQPLAAIATWDGVNWSPMGTGLGNFVYTMQTWDPDGNGPARPVLVAGGSFQQAGSLTVRSIAAWDGESWSSLGPGLVVDSGTASVEALTTWDPDADGPASDLLIAAGFFIKSGSPPLSNVAAWNGAAWDRLGGGLDGSVDDAFAWDFDGAGPEREVLLATGRFTIPGTSESICSATWDGESWSPVGVDGELYKILGVAPWDPDGSGPAERRLVAHGTKVTAGVYRNVLMIWDGSKWAERPGTETNSYVEDLVSWRRSETVTSLVAVGNFTELGSLVTCGIAASSPCCPADLSGDGVVDFGDYLEFLNLFDAADSRANLNGDGVIDFADYLEFLNHYDAGC